jgi:hypothetical protein
LNHAPAGAPAGARGFQEALAKGWNMNTIGKILVILNLVFALVVGGFLVIDFGTRTNWRTAYESLKREMVVGEKNINVSGKTLQELKNQVRRVEAENAKLKQEIIDNQTVAKATLDSQKAKTEEEVMRAKDADLSAQKSIAEKDRLKEEVKRLSATIQDRDNLILTVRDENNKLRTQAIAKEGIAKTTLERNQGLLGQIADLERKIALREAGVGNENNLIKDPSAANPPSTHVKGRIERIDSKDPKVVQISLGSDQGLKQNQTLEVYRLNPEPLFLGRIRIMDAREHAAVGRLMPGISGRGPLQVGDIVESSIGARAP